MATVTEIREFRGVTRIILDGCAALSVRSRHFRALPLQTGEEIDPEQYLDRVAAAQFADAYEAALGSLDFCARTERELSRSLAAKGYVAPAVAAAIERLRASGLIDDRRYARRTAEVESGRPVGVYALKRKLRAKGVSDEDAEDALSLLDAVQQAEAARRAAKSLARKYEGLPAREAKAKLSQALARRGFAWEAVREAAESLFADDDWE